MFHSGSGGDQNRAKRRVNIGVTFARLAERGLKMDVNVASHQPDVSITRKMWVFLNY